MTPKFTVLVVDDTPANLGLVLESLGTAGLRVLVGESGAPARELLAQHCNPSNRVSCSSSR
jgi:CheY-like chemotaxis protein